MIRTSKAQVALLILCALPFKGAAQCDVGPDFLHYEVIADAIQPLFGTSVGMGGTCGQQVAQRVKFRLTTPTASSGLIVSPGSGTTPMVFHAGVDPRYLANLPEGGMPRRFVKVLNFETVDQVPVRTVPVFVTINLRKPDRPVIRAVVSAASMAPVVTPGAVALIKGSWLGPNGAATLDQAGVYPDRIGISQVTFNGIAAPLLSTSPTVIKAVVPYGLAGQPEARVVVTHNFGYGNTQESEMFSVPVVESSLGIFSRTPTGSGQADVENCDAFGCTPNGVDNPAAAGSMIVFYGSGLALQLQGGPRTDGAVAMIPGSFVGTRIPVSLTIGGQQAQILYLGIAPYQLWGIFQVNARIPPGVGSGPQPLVLTVGEENTASQQATVAVL